MSTLSARDHDSDHEWIAAATRASSSTKINLPLNLGVSGNAPPACALPAGHPVLAAKRVQGQFDFCVGKWRPMYPTKTFRSGSNAS